MSEQMTRKESGSAVTLLPFSGDCKRKFEKNKQRFACKGYL
jgi:hypothetical protein